MASLSEIIQLCRLCLVKDHVNISIFDDPENVRQIPLKISSCLPVKISRDDNLPKKICDGCSSKLDLCYDFWTSTAQAEKTLLCMAKEKENQVPEAVIPQPLLLKVEPAEELLEETQICEPPVPKPIIVKKEVEPAPTSVENEAEEPAAKRPRRSAAIKAQMQIAPESDDDDAAEGLGTTEDVADVEDDIEDPDIPDMNVEIDDVKPGPSGLNQRSADSELRKLNKFDDNTCVNIKEELYDIDNKFGKYDADDILEFKFGEHIMRSQDFDDPEPYSMVYHENATDSISSEKSLILYNKKQDESLGDMDQSANPFDELSKGSFESPTHEKTYQCKCGKSFILKAYLSTHLLRVHSREKLHKCLECAKSFSTKTALTVHRRSHTGEKPYKCTECEKCFSQSNHLSKHLRTHTGVKIYKCEECDKRFAQKWVLNRHLMVHSREERYKCVYDECGKCFSSRYYLRLHLQTHIN